MTDRLWRWLAWHAPRRLIYWSTIRLFAHATTGRWSSTVVPELEIGEALKRWDRRGRIDRFDWATIVRLPWAPSARIIIWRPKHPRAWNVYHYTRWAWLIAAGRRSFTVRLK